MTDHFFEETFIQILNIQKRKNKSLVNEDSIEIGEPSPLFVSLAHLFETQDLGTSLENS